MKANFVIERTRLLQNKVIRQCLADQLFASAFGFDRIIDLLTTVKSRFFALPRPIIVKYFHSRWRLLFISTMFYNSIPEFLGTFFIFL